MNALSYGIFLILPASVILGLVVGGPWVWATPILLFGITPVMDALLGLDKRNLNDEEEQARAENPLYDFWLYLIVPVQLGLLVVGASIVPHLDTSSAVGLTVSFGLFTGAAGITVAHELMHRAERLPRGLAEILMLCASYPHFCIEHVLGHHKHVATPRDSGSAPRGKDVYSFLPRALVGSLHSAWQLEGGRVAKKGIRVGSWQDRRLRMPLSVLAVWGAFFALGGWGALLFFVAQSAVAFVLLEVINYVEHYGLRRAVRPDGRYERVLPRHSWNSAHRLSGRYLFNLPRHADHHFKAARPYFILRHIDDSPQMPAGYGTMVLVALVPPLWFSIMNPRVDAWTQQSDAREEESHDRHLQISTPSPLA